MCAREARAAIFKITLIFISSRYKIGYAWAPDFWGTKRHLNSIAEEQKLIVIYKYNCYTYYYHVAGYCTWDLFDISGWIKSVNSSTAKFTRIIL